MGPSFYKEEELVAQMKNVVRIINNHGLDRIDIEPVMGMSQQTLNDLHDIFEKLESDPRYHSEQTPGNVLEAVCELNVLIHKTEQVHNNPEGGMVEINFETVEKHDLEESDYQYFTPDYQFSDLYITYGQTGVPPINAFQNDVRSKITPQTTYTAGSFLYFYPSGRFNRWQEFLEWSKDKDLGPIEKGKYPFGYVPIAKLLHPQVSKKELLQIVSEHMSISKMELIHQDELFPKRDHTAKDRVRRLVQEKVMRGEDFTKEGELYFQWKANGLHSDSLPGFIKIIVVDDERITPTDWRERCLSKVTEASLFPMDYDIVLQKDLTERTKDLPVQTEFVAFVSSGTLISDLNEFIVGLLSTCSELRQSGNTLAIEDPHRLHDDRPNSPVTILDLKKGHAPIHWNLDRTHAYGERLKNSLLWISPLKEEYAQRDLVESRIRDWNDYCENQVFFFNNEPSNILPIENFTPDQLISVAAGFKPIGILNQYWSDRSPQAVHFTDFSSPALKYIEGLGEVQSQDGLSKYIFEKMQSEKGPAASDIDQVRNQLQTLLEEDFGNDFAEVKKCLGYLRNAQFMQLDFISNSEPLLELVHPEKKTIIWHSNAWYNNGVYFHLTKKELDERYDQLIINIAKKLGTSGWRRCGRYEAFFGESLRQPHTFMTDGTNLHRGPSENDCRKLV